MEYAAPKGGQYSDVLANDTYGGYREKSILHDIWLGGVLADFAESKFCPILFKIVSFSKLGNI